jgi:hypothetical protein
MKLTDELKKKIDNAASEKEVKGILENVKEGAEVAGIILDDAELDQAAGGLWIRTSSETPLVHSNSF